jgi:hypothetical protein
VEFLTALFSIFAEKQSGENPQQVTTTLAMNKEERPLREMAAAVLALSRAFPLTRVALAWPLCGPTANTI